MDVGNTFNAGCKICKYWHGEDNVFRECRRHAPVIVDTRTFVGSLTAWPTTRGTDCCGDFEPK